MAYDEEAFIHNLELYPCLYDKQDHRYKDSIAKNNAWKAVAQASGLNGNGKL